MGDGEHLAAAEAKLLNAARRARKGYSKDAVNAGDLLGSAIAEVAQQGVQAGSLDGALKTLKSWYKSRLFTCTRPREVALQ